MTTRCDPNLHLIGLDVGATKIAAGLGRPDGTVLARSTTETIRRDPEGLAEQVAGLVEALRRGAPVGAPLTVGVGICGHVDVRSGEVRSPIALGWPDPFALGARLKALTGLNATVDNDVNAAALGEMLWGSARDLSDFIYISIGTGIGAGIVANGKLIRGAHNAAGEVGHMVVDSRGAVCSCGNRGCLEALAGGRGFAAWVRTVLDDTADGITSSLNAQLRRGELITARDVFEAAEAGDNFSRRAVSQAAEYLAIAVVNLVNLLDPERIIFGGGLTRTPSLLYAGVAEALASWRALLVDARNTLCLSPLGQDAGIVGAMAAALQGVCSSGQAVGPIARAGM
jgi:glucokinase